MIKKPRVNKSKEEISAEMAHKAKIDRQKTLARQIFPFIEGLPSIYDAQTVVTALGGFIAAAQEERAAKVLVQDLAIDLSKEEDTPIRAAILALQGLLQSENANDAAKLLETFGNHLAQYSSVQFMKQPMSIIKPDDFIA